MIQRLQHVATTDLANDPVALHHHEAPERRTDQFFRHLEDGFLRLHGQDVATHHAADLPSKFAVITRIERATNAVVLGQNPDQLPS